MEKSNKNNKSFLSLMEEEVLDFWRKNGIFSESLKLRKNKKKFVFFEGPPSANGKPGIHHVLARSFKDLFCRYKSMKGFYVGRRAGWDTHGLPVELEAEKQLGIKNKSEIEKLGVEKFNKKCREIVWLHKKEWEELTERMGFWLDFKNPYITYENKYIESLWWIISETFKKGFLKKDYKVIPYCSRCGTGLSSHELAQPGAYKKIKENSVYVKFKIVGKSSLFEEKQNVYFLAWTTTPWTLPSNAALAVNPALVYTKAEQNGEMFVLAKDRINVLGESQNYKILKEFSGKQLLGLRYEPLYPVAEKSFSSAFLIISGDFVSAQDGTGIVHIAPAFGEDDLRVVKLENEKLKADSLPEIPIIITVDENGKMKKGTVGEGLFVKDADSLIVENLKNRNLILKEQLHEHEYPFCWRCGTPLIYYAKVSWFMKMSELRKKLVEENKKINWIPKHIKEGRFGEWIKEAKDWAFSRDRYFGVPIPVWQCKKCGFEMSVESIKDLSEKSESSGNNYFIMRHGKSYSNGHNIISCWPERGKFSLMPEGKKAAESSLKALKNSLKNKGEKIDMIFSSDLLRTKETSKIAQKVLGVKKIEFAKELREIDVGEYNTKPVDEYRKFYFSNWKSVSLEEKNEKRFKEAPKGGETLAEVKKRAINWLLKTNKKHKGKNILIVSHGDVLWMLEGAAGGLEAPRDFLSVPEIKTAEIRSIEFLNLPRGKNGEVDLHKPYIDAIKLRCQKCGTKMKRTQEVADVWFDSGSMPFAQSYFPFGLKIKNPKSKIKNIGKYIDFPADFICEGVDQTRGWFYTLLSVSVLLDAGIPYKNAVSLGLVLDSKGQKMSKSRGNVVSPTYLIDKYGIDAVRWYFYTVNSAGDFKLFDENDVGERMRKFVMTLWNTYKFFDLYNQKQPKTTLRNLKQSNLKLIDRWILSRLHFTVLSVSENMDNYDALRASRTLDEFVDDLSNWYVRRSRARFQQKEDKKDYEQAVSVLSYVLSETVKLSAPFVPFISETIYQKMRTKNEKTSVHLANYPEADLKVIDANLNDNMDFARKVSAIGLKARQKAKIKVRQPLAYLAFFSKGGEAKAISGDILEILKEELNVKMVEYSDGPEKFEGAEGFLSEQEGNISVFLDTRISLELKEEGVAREISRNIQEMRKFAGLTPKDTIVVVLSGPSFFERVAEKFEAQIKNQVLAEKIKFESEKCGEAIIEKEVSFDEGKLKIFIHLG